MFAIDLSMGRGGGLPSKKPQGAWLGSGWARTVGITHTLLNCLMTKHETWLFAFFTERKSVFSNFFCDAWKGHVRNWSANCGGGVYSYIPIIFASCPANFFSNRLGCKEIHREEREYMNKYPPPWGNKHPPPRGKGQLVYGAWSGI